MCTRVCVPLLEQVEAICLVLCTRMSRPGGCQSGLGPACSHIRAQEARVLGKSLPQPHREPWFSVLEAVLTLPSSTLREGRAWCPGLTLEPKHGLEGMRAQQMGAPGPAFRDPADTSGMH